MIRIIVTLDDSDGLRMSCDRKTSASSTSLELAVANKIEEGISLALNMVKRTCQNVLSERGER